MSIIKCPECGGQVSTMAGTCPGCGIKIAGNLRQCPNCGGYCLISQQTCPQCNQKIEPLHAPTTPEQIIQGKEEATPLGGSTKETQKPSPTESGMTIIGAVIKGILSLLLICLLGIVVYQYCQREKQEKEQADYKRLEGVTNPEFYQQFLIDHPDSEFYQEIEERMHVLQAEAEDWKQLLKSVKRTNIASFMQKHPNSLRRRVCEDMLDSIDWNEALTIGTEDAITDYLNRHPSGRYASDAAEQKNSILLAKVTPEEKAMIRGTLESFFSKAIANQDIEAAKAAIPDTMVEFCGKKKADAEAIVEYAKEKMAKDVIGLHYAIGKQLDVRKETLPDGNTGFAVEVSLQETISRSDANQPTSCLYNVKASLNHEQKIVRMNISRQ